MNSYTGFVVNHFLVLQQLAINMLVVSLSGKWEQNKEIDSVWLPWLLPFSAFHVQERWRGVKIDVLSALIHQSRESIKRERDARLCSVIITHYEMRTFCLEGRVAIVIYVCRKSFVCVAAKIIHRASVAKFRLVQLRKLHCSRLCVLCWNANTVECGYLHQTDLNIKISWTDSTTT